MLNTSKKEETDFPQLKLSKSCFFISKTPQKNSINLIKNTNHPDSNLTPGYSSINKITPYSKKHVINSNSISTSSLGSSLKEIAEKSNSKIISKFIPSVNIVKQYNNSLKKYFNLKPLKKNENTLRNTSEIKIKSSDPLFLGKTKGGSLCVNSNDFNIGFVSKRLYLSAEKNEKKKKKIKINPSFSNFVQIFSMIDSKRNIKKSQRIQKNSLSPNLKNIMSGSNNRKDMVTFDNYIFKSKY